MLSSNPVKSALTQVIREKFARWVHCSTRGHDGVGLRWRHGLAIRSELDANNYPTGQPVTAQQMESISLKRDKFHGAGITVLRRNDIHTKQFILARRLPTPVLGEPGLAPAYRDSHAP